ncbi:hypothetical protein J6590_027612 [Homalodisca vitripennis]|nr:hypothetical protein J6590_027612 [Homalodisca vitripennis]
MDTRHARVTRVEEETCGLTSNSLASVKQFESRNYNLSEVVGCDRSPKGKICIDTLHARVTRVEEETCGLTSNSLASVKQFESRNYNLSEVVGCYTAEEETCGLPSNYLASVKQFESRNYNLSEVVGCDKSPKGKICMDTRDARVTRAEEETCGLPSNNLASVEQFESRNYNLSEVVGCDKSPKGKICMDTRHARVTRVEEETCGLPSNKVITGFAPPRPSLLAECRHFTNDAQKCQTHQALTCDELY